LFKKISALASILSSIFGKTKCSLYKVDSIGPWFIMLNRMPSNPCLLYGRERERERVRKKRKLLVRGHLPVHLPVLL